MIDMDGEDDGQLGGADRHLHSWGLKSLSELLISHTVHSKRYHFLQNLLQWFTCAKKVMVCHRVKLFVCLIDCQQNVSKNCKSIVLKFLQYVRILTGSRWFVFGKTRFIGYLTYRENPHLLPLASFLFLFFSNHISFNYSPIVLNYNTWPMSPKYVNI